jgi:hypothetical protein
MVSGVTIEHHHLLRAMDALVEHKDEVDNILSGLLRPMEDQDLAVVFYEPCPNKKGLPIF